MNKKLIEIAKEFCTPEFFANPSLLMDTLNQLKVNEECVEEFDMYTDGSFLVFDVLRSKCEDELRKVISNIDAYQTANNERYTTPTDSDIVGLSLLHEIHRIHFEAKDEINWDSENDIFF